jgi:hypothetical protein
VVLRFFFLFWLYGCFWIGITGTLASLATFLVSGRAAWVKLDGKPVETIREKLLATGLFMMFALVGTIGIAVRRRAKRLDALRVDKSRLSSNPSVSPPGRLPN